MPAHMILSHTNCGQQNLPPAAIHDNETRKALLAIFHTVCGKSYAKVGPNAMVRNNVEGGGEEW